MMMSPCFRVPFCTSRVATGPRPLSRRASMTVPWAARLGLAFSSLHLGGEGQHLQQVIHAHAGLGGDGAHNGVAAPLLAHQAVLRELLLDALGVGARAYPSC